MEKAAQSTTDPSLGSLGPITGAGMGRRCVTSCPGTGTGFDVRPAGQHADVYLGLKWLMPRGKPHQPQWGVITCPQV